MLVTSIFRKEHNVEGMLTELIQKSKEQNIQGEYSRLGDVNCKKSRQSRIEFYGITFKKFLSENVSLKLVKLNLIIDYTSNSRLES